MIEGAHWLDGAIVGGLFLLFWLWLLASEAHHARKWENHVNGALRVANGRGGTWPEVAPHGGLQGAPASRRPRGVSGGN